MAVKTLKPAKSKFKKYNKVACLIALIIFLGCSVFSIGIRINNSAKIEKYEEQISAMEEKIEKISKENDEYTETLNSTDRRAYYEKVAREVHGYGKPGEYLFYFE